MSQTIGRTYSGPSRNWQEKCDYCDVKWHRNELVGPNDDGYLACPDCNEGRWVKTLDYQRAIDASEPSTVRGKTRTF